MVGRAAQRHNKARKLQKLQRRCNIHAAQLRNRPAIDLASGHRQLL